MFPKLMGNLQPYQYNIWLGNSKSGTSSGLHHDFHDNLYVLLKGRKQFRIYCPKDTDKMNTSGTPILIHPNGYIMYENGYRPDGAHVKNVQMWKYEKPQRKINLRRRI
eukprot:UN28729